MKTLASLLALAALAEMACAGQTNQLDLKYNGGGTPPPALPAVANGITLATPGTNSTQRLFREEKTYGGALTDLRRRKTQFFRAPSGNTNNPFQNVSVNPITGRADGIILFSIGF